MKKENIDYSHLTDTQKAYWAGLLDGEGCLMFYKTKTGIVPSVSLAMTCKETVDAFQNTFNTSAVLVRNRKSMKAHWKDCYTCKVTSHKAAKICEALLPYFLTKKKIAGALSEFYKRKCAICSSNFWSFGNSKHCSSDCYAEHKRVQSFEYRIRKKKESV